MADAKKTKSSPAAFETRSIVFEELRVASGEGDNTTITGYAAVFGKWSEDLGGFREKINSHVFDKTLNDGADVRALFNHNPDFVLGRTKSGTLRLKTDEKGLNIEIDAPTTQTIRDLVIEPIKRGDISQMSFAFQTVKDHWTKTEDPQKGTMLDRELLEAKLRDVSPVTYPAYPQTEVGVRSLIEQSGEDPDDLLVDEDEPPQEGHSLLADEEARLAAIDPDF